MSIAEKLTAVAENQQKIYDAGYAAGQAGGGYDEGYEQGKVDGNVLLYAVTLPSYANVAFPDGYELTLNIPNFRPGSGAFGSWSNVTGLRRLKLVTDATASNLNASTLMNSSSIEVFDISEFSRNFTQMLSTFLHCYYLREIIGAFDFTGATFNGYEFFNCYALEEIRIKSGTTSKSVAFAQSSKLSDASIQSILDGLADLTGQTVQTLTLHADVGAKLTDEQKAAATAKNWNLVY